MVESSCKSGLVSSTVDFINLIEEFIEQHTATDYVMIDKISKSDGSTKDISPSTIETNEKSVPTKQTESSGTSIDSTTSGIIGNPKLITILLFMNVILFAIVIYSVWCLNRKMNRLIQFQLYSSDGISDSPNQLFETPVKGDILNGHDPHHVFLQSLRSLLGIHNEESKNNMNELPEKILDKLMHLLDHDKSQ